MNGVNSWFCFRGSRIFCTSQYHLWLWLSIQISVSDFKNQVAWTSCSEINSLTSYHSPNINFVSSLVLSYSCLLWNTRGDSDFFNCIFHFDKSVPIACKCIFQQFRISWRKNVYQNKKKEVISCPVTQLCSSVTGFLKLGKHCEIRIWEKLPVTNSRCLWHLSLHATILTIFTYDLGAKPCWEKAHPAIPPLPTVRGQVIVGRMERVVAEWVREVFGGTFITIYGMSWN